MDRVTNDLSDEQWLMTCESTTCRDALIVRDACTRAGFEPTVHFESDDHFKRVWRSALGGRGWAFDLR